MDGHIYSFIIPKIKRFFVYSHTSRSISTFHFIFSI